MEVVVLIFIGIIIIAFFLLKGFDKVAGRGPKQVTDGINKSSVSDIDSENNSDSLNKLKQLDSMRKDNLITEDEYNSKKTEILNNM